MNLIKRLTALLLTLVFALTLAGCTNDITYITQYEDVKVYTGYYTCCLLRALTQASYQFPENTADAWSEKIDGKLLEDWVADTAHDNVVEFVALQLTARDMGVALTETDRSNAEQLAGMMKSYYQWYEQNDIADVEMIDFCLEQFLFEAVFQTLYGDGGEREIPAEDVAQYYVDNYIDCHIFQFSRYDRDGNLYTGTDLTDYNGMVKTYFEAATADPARMDELIATYNADRVAYVQGVSEDTTSDPLPTSDDTAPAEVASSRQTLDRLHQTSYPSELLDQIAALPYGVPTLMEYEDVDLIAVNYEITAESADDAIATDTDLIRMYMKEDELHAELLEKGKTLNLAFNGAATRKYKPSTLNLDAGAQQ